MRDVKAVEWLPLADAVERLSRGYERAFLENVGPIAIAAGSMRDRPVSPRQTSCAGSNAPEQRSGGDARLLGQARACVRSPDQLRRRRSMTMDCRIDAMPDVR